jgi:phosphatidylserine/phosphatidylglycerophosphate/cardiolipin synthase-like enzyme
MKRPYVSCYFSPRRGAADQIIGFIDHCDTTLDIAVYSLTLDGIAAAIIRAHQRGTKVRVLTDKTQASGRYADDEKLEAAGVPLRRDKKSGSMHNKFCIDGKSAVITGSFNWTANADKKNAENFVIVRLKYAVADFATEFERLWEDNA